MVPNRRLRPTALNAQLHEGFGVSTSRHPPSIRLPAKPCPGRLTVATAFGTAEFAAPHESGFVMGFGCRPTRPVNGHQGRRPKAAKERNRGE
jgi:hypothetical protein